MCFVSMTRPGIWRTLNTRGDRLFAETNGYSWVDEIFVKLPVLIGSKVSFGIISTSFWATLSSRHVGLMDVAFGVMFG